MYITRDSDGILYRWNNVKPYRDTAHGYWRSDDPNADYCFTADRPEYEVITWEDKEPKEFHNSQPHGKGRI